MLTQFAKELVDAQSSIDWACFSGVGVFDIVLAALLAATTHRRRRQYPPRPPANCATPPG